MQLKKPLVDIILPPDLAEVSASALKLCELFLERLIKSTEKSIDLSVDVPAKAVRCNDPALRDVVRLIVGAGQFNQFAQQQTSLLHKTKTTNSLGELRCLREGHLQIFIFSGDISQGNWRIISD